MKKQIRNAFVIASFLVTQTHAARASDRFEQLELDSIQSAKTRSDLTKRLDLIEQLRRSEGACRWQLEVGRLPYSCYDLKPLTHELGIKPLVEAARLDLRCEHIARTTNETELKERQKMSPECFKLAKNRIRVNLYKLGKDFD
jgi:hypothetical protein